MQARRRAIAKRYTEAFSRLPELEPPGEAAGTTHAWHLYALRLNLEMLSIDRDQFVGELARRNIGSSVHFIPVHLHPYYRDRYGYQPDDFPVARNEFMRLVSLPLYPTLSEADVEDVIGAVTDIVGAHREAD
jgi:dTDP-4-amino-4,6-dideoxygalactose transaminase